MCNGESSRCSQGGTIAILKPTNRAARPSLDRELSFRLAQDMQTGQTKASFDGKVVRDDAYEVVIHLDGDLSLTGTVNGSVLHRFSIPDSWNTGVASPLRSRLVLGVGGEGIIGRRVSLLAGQIVVGDGIIGWN